MRRPIFSSPLWLCFSLPPLALTSPLYASEAQAIPPLMQANVYEDDIDVSAYWASEKLDGVRAYWDGKALISRAGNIFTPPDWFTEAFPDIPLDGELWMGRNTFEALSAAARRHPPNTAEWRKIRFCVFDIPGSDAPFSQRLSELRELVNGIHSPYLVIVEQRRVTSSAALQALLQSLLKEGAEGVMLHHGDAPYRAVRSDDLLKLKPHRDAEAMVIAHLPGQGKFQGMMGSLLVETPEGLRFKIGTGFTEQQRREPPAIGSRVSYKYYGKTQRGIPRFASFLRMREAE